MRVNWGNQPSESTLDRIAAAAQEQNDAWLDGTRDRLRKERTRQAPAPRRASFGRNRTRWLRSYVLLLAISWGEVLHWVQSGLRRSEAPTRRALQALILVVMLGGLVVSSVGSVAAAYSDYRSLRNLESQGLTLLKRLPTDLGLSGSTLQAHAVSASQIAQARHDLNAAQNDFQRLQDRLTSSDPFLALASHAPQIASLLQSAYQLSSLAVDATQIAQNMLGALVVGVDLLAASSLSGNTPGSIPGLTLSDLQNIQDGIAASLPDLYDLIARVEEQPTSDLLAALSDKERAEIAPWLSFIPQIPLDLPVVEQFLQVAPTILGVTKPTAYLLLAMDPSELRPSGGFQGNDAVVGVNAGRIGTISLQDVYLLDRPYNATYPGDEATPPGKYANWWPTSYLPWGLRDANLAADFPTSAQYDLQLLQAEGGDKVPIVNSTGVIAGEQPTQVGGVIAIEPAVIEQLLTLTGPVAIEAPYNVTITADNVEQEIHYFQLTKQGRALGGNTSSSDSLSSQNKRFTALLSRNLLAKLKTLPKSKLLQVLPTLLGDLHTKDIQVYFSDPAAENFLRYYQISAEMYTGTQDALMIDDANISGNKASQYLTEDVTDSIALDAAGGATHTMTISYSWNPPAIQNGMDPTQVYAALYNADTVDDFGLFYREYVRIYTAPNPSVIASSGWQFGGIETTTSDVPGRGMIGAHYLLNGNADQQPVTWNVPTVTLTWHVNNVYTPGSFYELHLQHQAGDAIQYAITITPPVCDAHTRSQSASLALTSDQVVSYFVPAC
jgi:hypothetical protein